MTEEEATRLAEGAASEAGRNLSDFEAPTMRRKTGGWWFFYVMKSPAPVGGHFSVEVSDDGDTRFIPGR